MSNTNWAPPARFIVVTTSIDALLMVAVAAKRVLFAMGICAPRATVEIVSNASAARIRRDRDMKTSSSLGTSSINFLNGDRDTFRIIAMIPNASRYSLAHPDDPPHHPDAILDHRDAILDVRNPSSDPRKRLRTGLARRK